MSRRKTELTAPADPKPPFLDTHRGRALLAGSSVILLTLAFAPIGQFYLAWVGLIPWLVLIARSKTNKSLFWWSWFAGFAFFAINMWWLVFVTVPGAITLVIYLGLWFAVTALVIRAAGVLSSASSDATSSSRRALAAVLLIPALWIASEWIRGNLFTGLPWLYLGHTQTPILPMCQVADFASAYGVSFWVVMVNTLAALFILEGRRWKQMIPAAATVVALLIGVFAYGAFRMRQQTTEPGPIVMVVQPNYPQDNSGSKGAPLDEIVNFHIRTTRDSLRARQERGQPPVDLVVWSETTMPDINKEYRQFLRASTDSRRQDVARFLDTVHDELVQLSERFNTNLLVGGVAMMPDRERPGKQAWNRFNSAYLFDPSGRGAAWRYDKIHLVPFGEFIPFRESFPPLYKFFNLFNPYDSDYTVTQGKELTVFAIPQRAATTQASNNTPSRSGGLGHRFVTPICFEDIDSRLVSAMFRGEDGAKRAQFIVNLTNDGWFRANEMPQHLQAATFRSIENRAPTARSVNTGISGFIDSVGRTHDLLGVAMEGVSTARLHLDRRVTFYTRNGDVFPGVCVVIAGGLTFMALYRWMKNRRAVRR